MTCHFLRHDGGLARRLLSCLTIFAVLCPGSARAHHVMDSRLPQTAWEGLLSGLAHPIIGVDHLAFIIAAGVIVTMAPRQIAWVAPIPLLAAIVAGAMIHLRGVDVLFNEGLILFSLAAAIPLLWPAVRRHARHRDSILAGVAIVALFPIAGLVHGYAYGESIIGARTTTIVSYLFGFSLIQYAIMASIIALIRWKDMALPVIAGGTGLLLLSAIARVVL